MAEILGFEIKRKKPQSQPQNQLTVVTPLPDDGATVVNNAAAYYGLVIDLEGVVKNENDLLRRYREVSQYPDCDTAIEDIVNEAIVGDPNQKPVTIILDDLQAPDNIKEIIRGEFTYILKLLKFEEQGHDVFKQWYIDGRKFYHIILDQTNPALGIQKLEPIDPRKIRKIRNIKKQKNAEGVEVIVDIDEYYLYNDKGLTEQTSQGVKLSVDSVVYATSGLIDSNTNIVLSWLHKAIKPVNQLKMMEDALVIYRISRAPERRIFYIDVGNLPKLKAEQYVNDMMVKFRNKIVYDASTGEIKDNRQHLSLMEDFWMPRREGGKGTEITTLGGGQNLGQIEDIQYFQTKLYQALNVPLSRLQPQSNFSLGRASEITREEIKFNKFIERLRKKFAHLFRETLKVQLISKGIIRPEEWDAINDLIRFDYQRDNYFDELKNAEIYNSRIAMLGVIDPFVGRYFSSLWVRKEILQQTEEDMENMNREMELDRQIQLEFAAHQGEVEATKMQPSMDQQAARGKK